MKATSWAIKQEPMVRPENHVNMSKRHLTLQSLLLRKLKVSAYSPNVFKFLFKHVQS